MDPTANLKQQLDLAHRLLAGAQQEYGEKDVARDAHDLAERVIALATWIERGGFLPETWQHGDRAPSPVPDATDLCPVCLSDEVQAPMWVSCKDGQVHDYYGISDVAVWCPDCEEHYTRFADEEDIEEVERRQSASK